MEMTNRERTQALARSFANSAAENYRRDGYLAPVLILLRDDGGGLILTPHPEMAEHPGEGSAMLTAILGRASNAVHIGFICESWIKRMHHEAGDPEPTMQRGQLAKEAETDPDIKTDLMVMVLSVKNWDDSYVVHQTFGPFSNDAGVGLGLEPMEIPGFPEGHVPDIIKKAYLASPPMELPDAAEVCSMLMAKKLAVTAAVMVA
jgi:hypothetical protein